MIIIPRQLAVWPSDNKPTISVVSFLGGAELPCRELHADLTYVCWRCQCLATALISNASDAPPGYLFNCILIVFALLTTLCLETAQPKDAEEDTGETGYRRRS